MNLALVEKIANAVLYEGYMLYPYRPSAVKNRRRWNFGVIYPQDYSSAQGGTEPWTMQTEVLCRGCSKTVPTIKIKVRFLHLLAREIGKLIQPLSSLPNDAEPEFCIVDSLRVGKKTFHTWQEAVEREISIYDLNLGDILTRAERVEFAFLPLRERELEPIHSLDGKVVGVIVQRQQPIEGVVEVTAQEVGKGVWKVTVRILNSTPYEETEANVINRDEALMRSFVSTHTILGIHEGEFISSLDPPEQLRSVSAGCSNVGTWPVLVGEEGEKDLMLSSPIILYDYPQIAPESSGDLFDGTEIDELLTLRIMTLTDEEKREMREADERARQILERTETLPVEQLMKLHGAVRHLRPIKDEEPMDNWNPLEEKPRLDHISVGEVNIKPGDRVRLRPRQGGSDVFDEVLKGKTAIIESIEQDYEDRIYIVVTVEEDPGKEFGFQKMPGHRFFFSPEEVEPLGD